MWLARRSWAVALAVLCTASMAAATPSLRTLLAEQDNTH